MPLLQISPSAANRGPEDICTPGDDKDAIKDFHSSCSADSDHTEAIVEVRNYQEDNEIPTIAMRMLNLAREFTIFCLIMLTYAALTKDPPKVAKPPAAYPFFSKDTLVADWYRGQISKGIEYARTSDIAFVMYYAPWDAQSQATRKEFEMTANFMQDYVTFLAVNCWHPYSECRTQYSKVYRWPVLIAYPSHGRGVQYNGPLTSLHMIQFLKKIINPIIRISDKTPIEFEDAYVIATLSTLPGSRDFVAFYTAAMKYLEKDPQYRITFYVNSLAVSEPSLTLHLWNETLTFPIADKPWIPEEILLWIFKNSHQVTSWVLPNGAKNYVLSNSMQDGPSLILFTPRNPLHFGVDYYNMLQEIGQEYYNCDDNVIINFQSINIKLKRSANLLQYRKHKIACKTKVPSTTRKIISHLKPTWSNTSNCFQEGNQKSCNVLTQEKINYICSKLKIDDCLQTVNKMFNTDMSCAGKVVNLYDGYTTSMLTGINDSRSPENILKLLQKETCRQWVMAENIYPSMFEDVNTYHGITPPSIDGLSCKTNKSLTLLAMDSLLHYHFAQRLGIDLSTNKDKSAAVIINDKMESHYILQGPINGFSLRQLIVNFTNNELNRSLNSISMISSITSNKLLKPKTDHKSEIVIEELDTNSFLPTVLQENKAFVVLYYTKQCSFCNGISYIFLTVARKLKYLENLYFARIDGDINILPWEYTMESYPTILFFPANRKPDTTVFQSGISINVSNLIGFILSNLEPNQKLQAVWSICNQLKLKEDKSTCYSSLLGETLSLIDRTLSEWRKSNKRQQKFLLYKLKQLRQLHLLFAHRPQNYQLILNHFKKLNVKITHINDYHNLKIYMNIKDEL